MGFILFILRRSSLPGHISFSLIGCRPERRANHTCSCWIRVCFEVLGELRLLSNSLGSCCVWWWWSWWTVGLVALPSRAASVSSDMLLLELIRCHLAIGTCEDPKREDRWFLQLLSVSFTMLEAKAEAKAEEEEEEELGKILEDNGIEMGKEKERKDFASGWFEARQHVILTKTR